MQPKPNTEIVETPIWTMWFDDSGILCFLSKNHPPQTMEESKTLFGEIQKFSKGEKHCWIMDTTKFQLPTKEARDYGATEMAKLTKAIAFISHSPLGKVAINILLAIKPQPFPAKMFTDEHKAREGLKQFL